MALHVHLTHVDGAVEAKAGANRGGRDAVLTGPGFGNDAVLAETAGEQDLAERVIDLVRASMQQVLALQVDFSTAELLGQALCEIQRRGAADVVVQ